MWNQRKRVLRDRAIERERDRSDGGIHKHRRKLRKTRRWTGTQRDIISYI